MMNKNLRKDNKKSSIIIKKLQQDIKNLLQQSHENHFSSGEELQRHETKPYNERHKHHEDSYQRHDRHSRLPSSKTKLHPNAYARHSRSISDSESDDRLHSVLPPYQQPTQEGPSHGSRLVRKPYPQPCAANDGHIMSRKQQPGMAHQDEISERVDANYTTALEYVSIQMGDLSEEEKTSLKEYVESKYSPENELDLDIKIMCDKMKELRCDRQEVIKTDIQQSHDPNLTCPHCDRKFRHGEIQKFRKHAKECN